MLLTLTDLKHWTGYKRPGDVERWLRERGVKYWRGAGGQIATTEAMVNDALRRGEQPVDVEFDDA